MTIFAGPVAKMPQVGSQHPPGHIGGNLQNVPFLFGSQNSLNVEYFEVQNIHDADTLFSPY